MADIKKFLDQGGVSILWGQVAANLQAEVDRAKAEEAKNAAAAKKAQDEVDALETYVGVIPNGEDGNPVAASVIAYVNKKTEGIATDAALSELQETVNNHTDAINLLNGDAETVGSVANTATTVAAAEVAKIVANADADFDTLKEIADWILNDTSGAADMANDIAALEAKMAGVDTTVVASIASAIEAALKVDGADKYALASELTALAARVKTLEDADLDNRVKALEDKFDGDDSVASLIATAKQEAIDAAATDASTKANSAETNAKAHADGLNTAMNTRVAALEAIDHSKYELAGAAAQTLTDAKAYTDAEVAKIQALTEAEILAAIGAQA